jgi:flavin-dependent dehydrogenase
MIENEYDVIVIGGGPGGAAAATLTAQNGHRVLLVERSHTPRFKIGESLMPATYHTFKRMGILPKLKDSPFVKKYSVQFYGRTGRASAPFYFSETDPDESSQTWQVLRSEFDALLLEHAQEQGVEVRRGAAVKEVYFDGDRAVGVRLDLGEEEGERDVAAKVIADASGQTSVIARRFGLRRQDAKLLNAAFYTHFQGAVRDPGIDEGATLVVHTNQTKSWFWFIPLHDDRVSVGVVGSLDYLISGRAADPQQVFDEEVARCRVVERRIANATQIFPVQATKDFSYRSSRIAGDGWVLVGDAFGFLDPIYSSGVFLSLKSGELAADSIHAALVAGDPSAERLGAHGPSFLAGMEAMRKLVYAYYEEGFSFSKFLRRFPRHRLAIVNMLVGNVHRPTNGLFEDMAQMVNFPEEATLAPHPEPALEGRL